MGLDNCPFLQKKIDFLPQHPHKVFPKWTNDLKEKTNSNYQVYFKIRKAFLKKKKTPKTKKGKSSELLENNFFKLLNPLQNRRYFHPE